MEAVTGASSAQLWDDLLRSGRVPDDEFDDERAVQLVAELNRRAEPELVGWALPLLHHPQAWHRQAAGWLLQDHGVGVGHEFTGVWGPAVADAARAETDEETRAVLVHALGRTGDPAWGDELMTYAVDPYPEVRAAVARTLPVMFSDDELPDAAVAVMIALTRDVDPEIRDWATFGLGAQSDRDSDEIREALRARLDDDADADADRNDEDTATAGEALLGLARRHDPRIYDRLTRLLTADLDQVGNLTVEAAGALGDRRLLPLLASLAERGWQARPDEPLPWKLDEAIASLSDNSG